MNEKFPLRSILQSSWQYCWHNYKLCGLFALMFYALMAVLVWGWQTIWVWPTLAIFYVIWGAFFRCYFQRRPFLSLKALLDSSVPAIKIVLLIVVVATVFFMLPTLGLFIDVSPEFNAAYAKFMQTDMDNYDLQVIMVNVLFLIVSPWVAYRPFLAWISAILGRSGSLRQAWSKTVDNYWRFLVIAIITELSLMLLRRAIFYFDGNDYITVAFASLILVYFNVVAAQVYKFFFLDKI